MDIDEQPSSSSYRLVSTIDAHDDDIKSIHAARPFSADYAEQLFTASRDATCRAWGKRALRGDEVASWTAVETFRASDRYLNAVTALEPCDEMTSGQVIFAGLDHVIYCYSLSRRPDPSIPTTKPDEMLLEHWDNVTSLSIWRSVTADTRGAHRTLLISSSWDYSARVHELDVDTGRWKLLHFLRGAESAVWGACVIDGEEGKERYLTTSADLFIRLYEGDKLSVIFPGHEDVPRSICTLPRISRPSSSSPTPFNPDEPLFLTCSNDASLRIWSLDVSRRDPGNQTRGPDALRVLIPPDDDASIVYEAIALGNSKVASAGEGGALCIWNYDDATLLQTIRTTATSLWSLCVLPESHNIATAGSDGRVRIYSAQADAVEIQDAPPKQAAATPIDGEKERRENDEEVPATNDTGGGVADEMLAQALDSVPRGSSELASASLRLLHALVDRTLIAALDLIDREMVYRILPRRARRRKAARDDGYWHVLSSEAPDDADMDDVARLNADGGPTANPRSYAVFPRSHAASTPFCECPAFAIRCWGLDVEEPGARGERGVLESTRTPSKRSGGVKAAGGKGHVVVVCKHLLAVELARRLERYQTWAPDDDVKLVNALCSV